MSSYGNVNKKSIEHFIPKQLAYDECMVKYFQRYTRSCKQFIRGKSIRFGYNVWCVNTKDEYIINFKLD